MSILHGIILGAVQGVTEFLPVSSSGHVLLVGSVLGDGASVNFLFQSLLHVGTLIAVLIAFRRDIVRLITAFLSMIVDLFYNLQLALVRRSDLAEVRYRRVLGSNYRRFALLFLISCIPTAVIGYLILPIADLMVGNLLIAGMGSLITALLLLVSSFVPESRKEPKDTGVVDAVLIGAFQGFSGFPGISRLGMTVSSGYLSGLTRKFVIKYAFLLSIPTSIGSILAALRNPQLAGLQVPPLQMIVAIAVAAVVGLVMIHIGRALINKKTNRIFAIYCILIGVVSVVLFLR